MYYLKFTKICIALIISLPLFSQSQDELRYKPKLATTERLTRECMDFCGAGSYIINIHGRPIIGYRCPGL